VSEQTGNFDIARTDTTTIVTELVGEGKKYKTVEDLAKSRIEADSFIEKLKVENKALRETLDTDANPDEMLKRITELLNSGTKSGSEATTTTTKGNQSTSESLTEEKVLELLSRKEKQDKFKSNVDTFNSSVNKAFGDKTGEVIAARLDELGMEHDVFKDLAARNPNAALRILGLNAKEGGVSSGGTGESQINTEAYFGAAGKGNGETRNFKYFQNLRRELGHAYYEPQVQKEVFEQRKKLGDAFWK